MFEVSQIDKFTFIHLEQNITYYRWQGYFQMCFPAAYCKVVSLRIFYLASVQNFSVATNSRVKTRKLTCKCTEVDFTNASKLQPKIHIRLADQQLKGIRFDAKPLCKIMNNSCFFARNTWMGAYIFFNQIIKLLQIGTEWLFTCS